MTSKCIGTHPALARSNRRKSVKNFYREGAMNKLSTIMSITLLSLKIITTASAAKGQYGAICADLGRRMVQEKMTAYYKLNKMLDRKVATANGKKFDFKSLPAVISKNIDFIIAKNIVENSKNQLKSKSFDSKMELEEKLIATIQKQLTRPAGSQYLKNCENLYTAASKHCLYKYGAKTPSQNAQCVQQYVGIHSPYLHKIVPFASFASKWESKYKR